MKRKSRASNCCYCQKVIQENGEFDIKIVIRPSQTYANERKSNDIELVNRPYLSISGPEEEKTRRLASTRLNSGYWDDLKQGEFVRQIPRCEDCMQFHKLVDKWRNQVIVGGVGLYLLSMFWTSISFDARIAIVLFLSWLIYQLGLMVLTRKYAGRKIFKKGDLIKNGYVSRFTEKIIKVVK